MPLSTAHSDGKKIMFAAHTDEIGIVVTYIDEDGFLRFSPIGGVGITTLVGNRVRFANGTMGVIYQEGKTEWKELTLDKLYIDIGAATKEEALEKVSIGEFGIFHREFADLGNRLVAKSMDDRIGCAVLVEALRRIEKPKHTLYCVFTTQEEVGLRGARTAAFGLDPDLGIALDVTLTGDTPEARHMAVSLGKGAAIKVKDSSLIAHPRVKDLLVDLCEAGGDPLPDGSTGTGRHRHGGHPPDQGRGPFGNHLHPHPLCALALGNGGSGRCPGLCRSGCGPGRGRPGRRDLIQGTKKELLAAGSSFLITIPQIKDPDPA